MDRERALRELEAFKSQGGWYLPATDKWIRRINSNFFVIEDRKYAVTNRQVVEMARLECRAQRESGF